jgi:hypothetical protein
MPFTAGDGGDSGTADTGESGDLTLTEFLFREKVQDFVGEVSAEHVESPKAGALQCGRYVHMNTIAAQKIRTNVRGLSSLVLGTEWKREVLRGTGKDHPLWGHSVFCLGRAKVFIAHRTPV